MYSRENRESVLAALHFDDQLRVHAKCTDISVSLSPRRELENSPLLPSSRARSRSLAFSLFFSFLPALSQSDPDLRLRSVRAREFRPKVDAAEEAYSQASQVTEQQWGSESMGPRGERRRLTRREERGRDEREIEVGGGGGRRIEGDEEDVQEDAVVAED